MNIIHTADHNGEQIVKVPLVNSRRHAILYPNDFKLLLSLDVRPKWYYIDGHVMVNVPKPEQNYRHGYCPISRLIMDAGPRQIVKYLNRNRLDLRRSNLLLAVGQGKYRARELLKAENA